MFLQRREEKGFTLIEILLVVAIIGTLSTMISSSLRAAVQKGKNAKIVSTLGSTYSAIDLANYPNSLENLCFDFELGGELEVIRATIEESGGIWNCDSTVNDYRIYVKLNQDVILTENSFINSAYADSNIHRFGNYYCLNSENERNFTHWPGDNLAYPSCSDADYIEAPVDPEPTPEPTPDPEPETDPDPPAPSCSGKKVLICHYDKSICVSEKGWENGHSKHGDSLGAC